MSDESLGTVQRGDLTARAAIRAAAADLFAEHGFAAVSVRQIAAAAEVSPALVVHHFGSKVGLQAAVFEKVQEWFDALLDLGESDELREAFAARSLSEQIANAAQTMGSEGTVAKLFVRMILEREPAATDLVVSMAERSEELLQPYVDQGLVVDDPDPKVRIAVLMAQDLGLMLLAPQLSAYLGFDPMAPDGLQRWMEATMRVYAATFATDAPDPDAHPHLAADHATDAPTTDTNTEE